MDYLAINKELWNEKVAHHLASDFYDQAAFMAGKNSLKEIELAILGDVSGKRILHLQCHFGQDSLSLARMGAQVTGVDFSDKAIEQACALNNELGLSASFICCDIFNLPAFLDEQFDIVFTSYGTIGWLPDLDKWASVIRRFLKPGGRFVMADFHPVVWMLDDDFSKIAYRYFLDEPIIETEEGTYADKNAPIKKLSIGWNHGLGEIFQALKNNSVQVIDFKEYDYSPYSCFRHLEEFEPGKFHIQHLGNKIPMVYSIVGE